MVIYQEIIYTLRYTRAMSSGMMVKLDMEKTYDCMEWEFIEETLKEASLPMGMINIIMNLIRTSHCKLI